MTSQGGDLAYVARKIKRGKWGRPHDNSDEIRADAVSGGCLKTQGDALSVWLCAANDAGVQTIALAVGAGLHHLETIDLQLLPLDELRAAGFEFSATEGDTPVSSLRARHRDIIGLTGRTLLGLAQSIAGHLRAGEFCYRIRRAELKALLVRAVRSGELNVEDLRSSVRGEVEALLRTTSTTH